MEGVGLGGSDEDFVRGVSPDIKAAGSVAVDQREDVGLAPDIAVPVNQGF